MNPLSWLMLSIGIISSTILVTSSSHWLMIWACLEINTLSMIPMISKLNHPRATEAATKYFLTQTLASMTIMLTATMAALDSSQWEICQPNSFTTLTTLALMMKIAAAPFHFWLPEVTQGSSTMTALTILTWQKLAPLVILLSISNDSNHPLLLASAILSIVIGGLGGLNQTQLRKLMAFSSIAHTGWILTTMTIAPAISTTTFIVYTTTTTPIFILLHSTASTTIKDLGDMWTSTPQLTTALSITILSLGGLPPLTGFMPKWLILNKMVSLSLVIEATLVAITSLLSLYIYMRLTYIITMTTTPNTTTATTKWRPPNKTTPMLAPTLIALSTFALPLCPHI
uniref:NADH-ubiquinone oxidoreductase chain 2 n=1 Tax=Achalinus meiguensis TaxID=572522 RepID=B6ZBZ9_ACHME|nr:NADH dehydrogenase subunit 2 [Achalinus meiguensis]ACJ14777.1 NADH dehydrogenase subunit 2 [Achalinus meiguensis]